MQFPDVSLDLSTDPPEYGKWTAPTAFDTGSAKNYTPLFLIDAEWGVWEKTNYFKCI